jgi:hypothetical protein
LSVIEGDQLIGIDGILSLAAFAADFIVWRLCSIFEKLQKVDLTSYPCKLPPLTHLFFQRAFPDGTLPGDVLDSQLFILKILVQTLKARRPSPPPSTPGDDFSFKLSMSPSHSLPGSPLSPDFFPSPRVRERTPSSTRPSNVSTRSDSTSMSLTEPLPLDDKTVQYVLYIIRIVQRYSHSSDDEGAAAELYAWHIEEWDPVISAPVQIHPKRAGQDGDLQSKIATEKGKEREHMTGQDKTTHPVHSGIGAIPSHGAVQNVGVQLAAVSQYTMSPHIYARYVALHGIHVANAMASLTRLALS